MLVLYTARLGHRCCTAVVVVNFWELELLSLLSLLTRLQTDCTRFIFAELQEDDTSFRRQTGVGYRLMKEAISGGGLALCRNAGQLQVAKWD